MPEVELDRLQARLAGLGRPYTPLDVAASLRGMGLVVTDACLGKVTLSPLARDGLGPAPASPHRVLFVGNSLIYTGNLPGFQRPRGQ